MNVFKNNDELLSGLNTVNGKVTHQAVAECFNLEYINPLELI